MLRIKKDSVIHPYGKQGNHFKHETELSQAILEHLQTRFPDDIEDSEAEEKAKAEKDAAEKAEAKAAKEKAKAEKDQTGATNS